MAWGQSLVALVALAALLLYLIIVGRVGAARMKHGIEAPATTGHPEFERIFRVQQNTLEQLPVFLVALYLFSLYVSALAAAALGVLWIIGRTLYLQAYVAAPEKRGPGFLISAAATSVLLIGALIGVVIKLL